MTRLDPPPLFFLLLLLTLMFLFYSSHSVRSLIGRQSNEGLMKRSPDMSARKASTSSSISYVDGESFNPSPCGLFITMHFFFL